MNNHGGLHNNNNNHVHRQFHNERNNHFNHRCGANHFNAVYINVPMHQRHSMYCGMLSAMLLTTATVAMVGAMAGGGRRRRPPAVRQMSTNDEMIRTLVVYDPNALHSQFGKIQIELANNQITFTAGQVLTGNINLIVYASKTSAVPFPSTALTIQLLGVEES